MKRAIEVTTKSGAKGLVHIRCAGKVADVVFVKPVGNRTGERCSHCGRA